MFAAFGTERDLMDQTSSIETTVIHAIAATCQVDPADVHEDLALDDLGLGSMGVVAVISRLEFACGTEFSADDVVLLLQSGEVGTFIACVRELVTRVDPR